MNFRIMASLGIAIAGGEIEPRLPEEVLIESFKLAASDYKALTLLYTWVQRTHDLLHVEALIANLKSVDGSGLSRLIAGCLKGTGEKRFERIFKIADHDSYPELKDVISLSVDLGQCKADSSFAAFGLKVSEIKPQPERKFRPRNALLELNPFFFCRTLFGVNWRADIAACFLIGKAKKPIEVAKFLGCSYDAAYRNYHDLLSVGWSKEFQSMLSLRLKRVQ